MSSGKKSDRFGKRLRTITADLKLYLEKRIELTMLNLGEVVSGLMAASVQRAIGAFLILGGVCFLLFALAIYLGDLLNSRSLGYVLVSIPLLLMGVMFLYLKPERLFVQIQQRFENEVLKSIEQNGKVSDKPLQIEKDVPSQSKED